MWSTTVKNLAIFIYINIYLPRTNEAQSHIDAKNCEIEHIYMNESMKRDIT